MKIVGFWKELLIIRLLTFKVDFLCFNRCVEVRRSSDKLGLSWRIRLICIWHLYLCHCSCDQDLDVGPMLSGFRCSYPVSGRKRLKLLVAESSDSEPLVCPVPACDDSGGNLFDRYKASPTIPSLQHSSFHISLLMLSCMIYQVLGGSSSGFR